MSWFKRRPKLKESPKQVPHHISPMSEKVMKESKEKIRPSSPKKAK